MRSAVRKHLMPENPVALQLAQIVAEQLIPRLALPLAPPIVLAQQPWQLPSEISVRRRNAPPLSAKKSSSRYYLSQWKSESLHAMRYPYLCCALEGEADMRLAFPAVRGQPNETASVHHILTLRPSLFLLIPPGVFYPDGSRPLWERTSSPRADARFFWMLFLPTGAFCHANTLLRLPPDNPQDVFVPELQLSGLVEILIEELHSASPQSHLAAQSILTLIFLRVQRGLARIAESSQTVGSNRVLMSTSGSSAPRHPRGTTAIAPNVALPHPLSPVVERACHYIRCHLNQTFSIRDIAEYSHSSPSHLARLFNREMGITIMKYTGNQRIEHAQALLQNTELTIGEVARQVGYEHVSQFNRVFKRKHGVPPSDFRRRGL